MRILFTTSTMPASDSDPVPAFVKDEAIWLHKLYPDLAITILAPHNGYGNTKNYAQYEHYDEYRFHYFWPRRWELLTGKGIQPALKKNKWLYFELPGLFIAEFFATWRLVRRLKPNLIYAHWFTPQALTGALVSKITGVPLVFDTQASDAIVLKRVPFSRSLVAWVCRQAKSYTVPSQQTLDKLLHFATDHNREKILSKVTMVPYGTSRVDISKDTVKKALKHYGLEGVPYLYFIGRLVDRKGVDILINAFAKLRETEQSLKLVIVGDGQDREQLEALAKTHGVARDVIFTGFLTGKMRYGLLEGASICVLPSVNIGDQSEGLPVVFMEATLRRKITVITDATGAHEVSKDGRDTFIVEAGSADALKEGIIRALQTYRSRDKEFLTSVATLAKTFEWESVARRRYKALIETIKQ